LRTIDSVNCIERKIGWIYKCRATKKSGEKCGSPCGSPIIALMLGKNIGSGCENKECDVRKRTYPDILVKWSCQHARCLDCFVKFASDHMNDNNFVLFNQIKSEYTIRCPGIIRLMTLFYTCRNCLYWTFVG